MTFTGKPSRGCETCRKVHVKCDEKRPACSRCVRLRKVCAGYRDEVDAMFRIESGNSDSKSYWNGRRQKLENLSALGTYSQGLRQSQCGKSAPYLISEISRSLLPSRDDQILCYFYDSTFGTMAESDHSRYLHLQLPSLLSRSPQASPLYLAAQAISYAAWAKHRGNHVHTLSIARIRYVQSISALKAAIQDPIEVKSDENLYAVLLLCGYETMTFDSEVVSAWASHVDGAAALLRVRGRERLLTPLQCNMFLFIRRNAVHSHIQISRPVDPIFDELAETVLSFENTEDRLLSRMGKVPQLQTLANEIFLHPGWTVSESSVLSIIGAAETLDRELTDWACGVPLEWSYSVAANLNPISTPKLSTSCYVPCEIHGYADFYVARVWNLYRVSRLIIQSILHRAYSWLGSALGNLYQRPETPRIEKLIDRLVREICASVPFLLGYNLSQLKSSTTHSDYSDDKSLWPQNSSKIATSKHTGRFSLIWPLYISCSVATISSPQRQWMRAQLKWIAKHGEKQARVASEAQCQTLLGGPENFRFDCV